MLNPLLSTPRTHIQTHTQPVRLLVTTTGIIAVGAFEIQLMLYNRGLISPNPPPHPHSKHNYQTPQGQKKQLCVPKLFLLTVMDPIETK